MKTKIREIKASDDVEVKKVDNTGGGRKLLIKGNIYPKDDTGWKATDDIIIELLTHLPLSDGRGNYGVQDYYTNMYGFIEDRFTYTEEGVVKENFRIELGFPFSGGVDVCRLDCKDGINVIFTNKIFRLDE